MLSQPRAYWLSQVTYHEPKQSIIAVFQNNKQTLLKRYLFHPYLDVLVHGTQARALKELLGTITGTKYRVKEFPKSVKIFARNWKTLQKIHNLITHNMNARVIKVEPARAFLLIQNWTLWNEFHEEFGELYPQINTLTAPEFIELPNQKIHESIACEHLTRKKWNEEHNPNAHEINECILENALIQTTFQEEHEHLQESENEFYSEKEESTRNALLDTVLQYNISPITWNCTCCTPCIEKNETENILPHARVEVQFTQDGYYYDSQLRSFAREFHQQHSGKKERIQRKHEFWLTHIPIGPFYRNQTEIIPWKDVQTILSERAGILKEGNKLQWHCKKEKNIIYTVGQTLSQYYHQCHTQSITTALNYHGLANEQTVSLTQTMHQTSYLNAYQNIVQACMNALPETILLPDSTFLEKPQKQLIYALNNP